jgi:P4 family phage/plasmid primase-like protien
MNDSKPASLLEYALDALRRGFKVLPCKPRDKKPATEHGVNDASSDANQINKWWAQNPNFNPGITGGVIVDCDEGLTSLEQAQAWAKEVGLPLTLAVRTGRRPGFGVQFHFSGETKAKPYDDCKGVGGEIRGLNSYGIAPGAVHPSGERYEIAVNEPVAPWPSGSFLERHAGETAKKLHQNPKTLKEKVKISLRHGWLVSQCARLRHTGLGGEDLYAALRALCNDYCEAPHEKTDNDLRRLCENCEKLYGVHVPTVKGDRGTAFLQEQGRTYYEEFGGGEGALYLELSRINAKDCKLPLPRPELRRLSVELFEQLSGHKVTEYPGMFETELQNTADTGYGKHFIREHGYFVRYNKETSEWLVYSRGVWRVAHDEVAVGRYFKEQFISREKEALLNIYSLKDEVAEIKAKQESTKDYSPTMLEQSTLDLYATCALELRAARNGQESKNINSALQLARTEVGVDVTNEDLDSDSLLFNCSNMAIDLRTCNAVTERIHYLFTKQSPMLVHDEDTCPRFEVVLARSLPDKPTRDYLQEFAGLCLSGLMAPDILIFLGDGANGKSLVRNIIAGVLGDYHAKASMATFLVSKNVNPGGARTDIAGFRGKRLITASEANRKVMLDMEMLEDWTGNEDVNARDLWQKGKNAQFEPQGKILLLMNHPPRVIDQSEGTWRRLKYMRFDVTIPAAERNDKLGQEILEAEGTGILNWMLAGWKRVWARIESGNPGLVTPEKVATDTADQKEKESVVSRFFEDQLEPRDGWKIPSADVYACYAAWCKRNNEYQESSTELASSLKRYCFDHGIKLESRARVNRNARGYIGLKLKYTAEEPPEELSY